MDEKTSPPTPPTEQEAALTPAQSAGRAMRDLVIGAAKTALRIAPWLVRGISAGMWGYGILQAAQAVAEVYGKHTPKISLYALVAVPALIGLAAPTFWIVERQKQNIWGAFLVTGLLLWAAAYLLRQNWRMHPLEVAFAPFALAAFAHAYLTLSWRNAKRQLQRH